jgi:hypothetical protein
MRLDDLDTCDDEVDSGSSFDADGKFTLEDGEDVRDRDYSDIVLYDVTYAYLYVQNLPDLGPIISGLS